MAITAALIAGGASLASAGIGAVAGSAANQRGNQDARSVDLAQLQDARNNEAYIQQLNSLMLQNSRAGFQDSEGNTLRYDPATNTYVSALGQQPADARRAALNAQIERDTTDQSQARRVNEAAERRALEAEPALDSYRRQIAGYQPITGSQLGDMLQQRGAMASNDAYRPLIQQALTQAQRTGSASGPIIADIGRQSAADLRKNAIDSMIQGQTSAGDINKSNLGTLGNAYGTLSAGAQPSLQFPGIATDDQNKTMAQMAMQRAELGVTAGANAGRNTALAGDAAGKAAAAVPTPDTNDASRTLNSLGQQIGPAVTNALKTFKDAGGTFGSGTTENDRLAIQQGNS
jgi:hypothetical protein